MTKYLEDKFTVAPGQNNAYRDNFEKIFRKGKKKKVDQETDPEETVEENSENN